MKIQINPFEIARLAANLKISTTEFIRSFTVNGVYLGSRSDARCIFLEPDGCRVHDDRPLVCRLYPLGRNLSVTGEKSFVLDHLLSKNCRIWSASQTIDEYLVSQGAPVFINAAEYYQALLRKLASRLQQEKEFLLPQWLMVSHGSDLKVSFPKLLDPDWVIKSFNKKIKPADLDPWHKMVQHVRLVENWINGTGAHGKECMYGQI